ncbi:unnamed protein product [Allacma fusca]|uniref:DUF1736 domain-containing protein n=1 Tax=Allacma fusca TaxID=39272 RepID=A0A8J2JP39_9HEXA|nr:unnamed protein product [Allacma fusca]
MFSRKARIDWVALWSSCLAFIVYLNSFKAGFVYDDNRAILSNLDVLPETPWASLMTNDFWGSPLSHSGSHKSFRPLTTLTFRLNYYFSGFNPWSYHLTNVLLHTLTTWLFVRVARIVFRSQSTSSSSPASTSARSRKMAVLVSSLLFACHPIHTEAVTGVVGRAEVGSTGFALAAFLLYVSHVKYRDKLKQRSHQNHHHHHHQQQQQDQPYQQRGCSHDCNMHRCTGSYVTHKKLCRNEHQNSTQTTHLPGPIPHHQFYFRSIMYLAASIILAAAAMFTKEQGITILLVCATYDLIRSIIRERQYQTQPSWRKLECSASVIILGVSFLALFHLRVSLMGGFEPPKFARADNPTAHHGNVCVRLATFLFLPVLNIFLLLYPYCLSYDWSMEAVPRVTEISDPRNLITVLFYFFLVRRIVMSFKLVNKSMGEICESEECRGPGVTSPLKNVCNVCRFTSSSNNQKCSNNNSIIQTPAWTSLVDDQLRKGMSGIHHHHHHHHSGVRKQSQRGGGGGGGGTGQGGPHFKFNSINSNKLSRALGKTFRRQVPSVTSTVDPSLLLNSSPAATSACSGGVNSSIPLEHGAFLLELAFLICPFLPATNLFFYVGFVIAERVLYFPSVGFCLLAGHGFLQLWTRTQRHNRPRLSQILITSAIITLLFLSLRTARRNEDWRDEEELYSAGIPVNPPKSWGNLANVLHNQGRLAEAEVAYRQALRFRSNMADVHYNLGLLLEGQGRLDEALTSYRSAIHFRPLLAPGYLNAGQVLIRQRKTREAMELYEKCFKLSDEGVKDLRIHIEAKVTALLRYGKLLVEEDDDPKTAIGIYRQAVKLMPPHFSQAQSVYNALGEALSRVGEASQAEEYFKEALRRSPDHIPAHLTYGMMLARNKTRLLEAESWFRRAKRIAPADARVYQHYGQFLASQGRNSEAAESYVMADALTPNDYEIVVGAANGLRQAGDNLMAEVYYEKAVALRPQEARAHMNLGAIRHLNRKYPEAHESYLTALILKPNDPMTMENLKKLCQLQGRTKLLQSCSRLALGKSLQEDQFMGESSAIQSKGYYYNQDGLDHSSSPEPIISERRDISHIVS